MLQAIVTKYLGPTNTKGSRVKATCYSASVTVPFNYADDFDACRAAVEALCRKLKWNAADYGCHGMLPNGDYVFVCKPVPAKTPSHNDPD